MGYRPAAVIGRPFLELIYPEDHGAAQEMIAKLPGNGSDIAPATLRYKHADGSLRTLETLTKNCTGTLGECGLLVSTRDITRRVAEEKALRGAIAVADDLYNNAPRGYQSLDEHGVFVRINDTELRWLGRALRDGELLARLSSDSFAVVLRGSDAIHASDYGPRIEHTLAQPFQQAGVPISVHLHIGAAVAPEHGLDPEVLVLRSGIAARHAEESGTTFALYDGPSESESPRYLALISDLRAAIAAKQLVLHYQPKLDLRSGRVCGAEALVRWQHPKRGLIMPCEFIGLAEQTELIRPLTYHVVDAALRQCNLWRGQGFDLPVAVNISANSLNDPDFLNRIEEALQKWDLRPELLQLEITESALIEEPAKAHDLLVRLKDRRILVSLDDFGTGYSSLGYVASLPFDALKIDRSFVSRMLESPRTNSVVAATIALAHSLAIKTVAEGVETKDQVVALVAMGCTEVQGYFFCRPVEAEKLRHWAADFSLDFYGIQPASGQGPKAKSPS